MDFVCLRPPALPVGTCPSLYITALQQTSLFLIYFSLFLFLLFFFLSTFPFILSFVFNFSMSFRCIFVTSNPTFVHILTVEFNILAHPSALSVRFVAPLRPTSLSLVLSAAVQWVCPLPGEQLISAVTSHTQPMTILFVGCLLCVIGHLAIFL